MRVRLTNGGVTTSTRIDDFALADLRAVKQRLSDKTTGNQPWWKKTRALFKPSQNSVYEGLYVQHLYRWHQHFSSSHFLLFYSVEFFHDPAKVLAEVLRFINLDPSAIQLHEVVRKNYNTAEDATKDMYHPQHYLSEGVRGQLNDFFEPYNRELEKFVGRPAPWTFNVSTVSCLACRANQLRVQRYAFFACVCECLFQCLRVCRFPRLFSRYYMRICTHIRTHQQTTERKTNQRTPNQAPVHVSNTGF